MLLLQNYALGAWQQPKGDLVPQFNAISGELISEAGDGLDFAEMCHYARTVGGKNLRAMTFFERGLMLKKLALFLTEKKAEYYNISYQSGATRIDNLIDIDGGIGNLFAYASLRRQMGSQRFYVDGQQAKISKQGTFVGQHIMVPKLGVAIHINAFNFPVWGMLEKVAVNWLAGMPAIVKASEITSYVTAAVVRDIIASGIVPEGALQFLGGKGHGIVGDHLTVQDVVTFTGSAATGKKLRALPVISDNSIPFNLEADSLNAMILGTDVTVESPEFDIFVKEVRKEMTVKTGQKCTAVRRILVPSHLLEAVQTALSKELAKTVIGNPQTEGVRMGALVNKAQQERLLENITELTKESTVVYGNLAKFEVLGADLQKGAFVTPTLLLNERPFQQQSSHNIEAFGPVATLMPYDTIEEAIELANMGKGSLVSTICTFSPEIAQDYVLGAAAYHGRILIMNRESIKESTGHGAPMPLLTHGGPGRAGGGEEMGGMRGVMHYLQRTAVQGTPTMLTSVTQTYQYGGAYIEKDVHPFRKHFEDLEVGETWITAKHTVTEADIVNFANLTGDNFYAHVDITSLEGTTFEQRVAHGYFILSKAAGLFVDAKKGPVLLNYGLEECRFTKPVYPNTTIGVRFTVKEKVEQEKKNEEDIAKGIVKFMVDVYDQTGETVAIATILTMVKKKNQG